MAVDIMGVVILGAIALYLILSLVVVVLAARAAKKRGKSPWRWGGAAALVMFLIPFWDWLPTVVVHQYTCSAEAGFWVYKTVDQWKAENPGVMETLAANRVPVLVSHEGDQNSWTDTEMLNQRITIVSKRNGPLFLHREKGSE